MARTLRVAHVITGLNTGGAEMMLCRLAQRLAPRVEQRIYSLTDLGPVAGQLAASGLKVEALGMTASRPNPMKLARLAWKLHRFRPDVVQTWLYHADLVGGLAARLAGLRALAWNIRNNDLSPEHSSPRTLRVVRLLARLSRTLPRRIVTCSQAALDTHAALGYARERFVVIPNGFDLARFRPDPEARGLVRAELGLPDDTPVVGLFARFDAQKNHRGFLAAAARLHAARPDVHFVLAGRGVDASNSDLVAGVRDAGLVAVVHLLGERRDMPTLNAALDLCVSASAFGEAFPNALGEAMACGVPCVATDAGDAVHIIGETGATVPRGDMAALARACERILGWPAADRHALGSAARQRIVTLFDLDAVAARYETLFHGLVAQP